MRSRAFGVILTILACFWLTSAGAAGNNDYTLGPGDVVKMSVYGHTDLTTVARISATGKTTLPLIGELLLGGMTLAEAETRIARELDSRGFVNRPQVTMVIDEYHSQVVAVLGFVNKPGQYPIEGRTTVLDMIARAGGLAQEGNYTVNLIRTEDGKTTLQQLDMERLLARGDGSVNLVLMNDDVVYVPRMDMFYIYGEVQHPGAYRLDKDMTVMQGIALSGGLTAHGSERGISIRRRQGDKFTTSDSKPTTGLEPNDVVFVNSSLF
jgi:polysaccharide export outer membrane protein